MSLIPTILLAFVLSPLSVQGDPPQRNIISDSKQSIAVEKKVSFKPKAPRQSEVSSIKETAPTVEAGVWDKLAACESGGNWSANTGNGYYGGLQWLPSTFTANGGSGMPHLASREEQIRVAENLRASQGFNPWPGCKAKLGL